MTIYNLRKHLPFRMHGLVWFKYLTTKHIVKTKQKSKFLFRLITMISPGIAKQVSSFDCIVKIIRVIDYFYTKKFYKNLVLFYSFSFFFYNFKNVMQNLMSRNINNTKYKTLVMLPFGNILIKFGKNISNFFSLYL